MARRARVTPGGLVYHVLNRSVAGLPLFRKDADFEAFERIMIEAYARHPARLLGWCVMMTKPLHIPSRFPSSAVR